MHRSLRACVTSEVPRTHAANMSIPIDSILRRLAAFTDHPSGGNPAGVWVGDMLPTPADMLRIAADVGYSETAFAAPAGDDRWAVRYYSPEAEVSFCGHATIALGVVLGQLRGPGSYRLDTAAGEVAVDAGEHDGRAEAALTSVEPRHRPVPDALLMGSLSTLGWSRDQLDPSRPPARADAGAWHLVLAVAAKRTLDGLAYDFAGLKAIMLEEGLTTLQLVWWEAPDLFHARDPFPVGGVVEDPATGAAAAALGGYLRGAGLLEAPASILIRQGEVMGRPSLVRVDIPEHGGIVVRGSAVPIEEPTDSSDVSAPAPPSR